MKNLKLVIPSNLQEKIYEIYIYDYENQKMNFWLTGNRKCIGGIETITIQEVIFAPRESMKTLMKDNIVGVLTTPTVTFLSDWNGQLTTDRSYVLVSLVPKHKKFIYTQITFEQLSHSDRLVSKTIHSSRANTRIIKKLSNLEVVITDCRPKTERQRILNNSLGNPFMPTGIRRILTADTYEKLSTKEIYELQKRN